MVIFKKSIILLLILAYSVPIMAKRVLIDPGHGGEDCGAKASIWNNKKLQILCEKELSLIIATKIKDHINKSNRHVAYLTRSSDIDLSLDKRSRMADIIKSDIFVSIHLNASPITSSRGFETYYLDNHKDDVIKKIEKVENTDSSSGQELIVNNILTSLIIDRVTPKSKELGGNVHNSISKVIKQKYKLNDRGLKPGMFYVLALSKRPSVLIEVGFLTNSHEAILINSKAFQDDFAKAVSSGVIKYLDKNSEPVLF